MSINVLNKKIISGKYPEIYRPKKKTKIMEGRKQKRRVK